MLNYINATKGKDTLEIQQDDDDQQTNKNIIARHDGQRTIPVVSLYLRSHSLPP
jgi:hypothetical protein